MYRAEEDRTDVHLADFDKSTRACCRLQWIVELPRTSTPYYRLSNATTRPCSVVCRPHAHLGRLDRGDTVRRSIKSQSQPAQPPIHPACVRRAGDTVPGPAAASPSPRVSNRQLSINRVTSLCLGLYFCTTVDRFPASCTNTA